MVVVVVGGGGGSGGNRGRRAAWVKPLPTEGYPVLPCCAFPGLDAALLLLGSSIVLLLLACNCQTKDRLQYETSRMEQGW